jgi:hypothetical protein
MIKKAGYGAQLARHPHRQIVGRELRASVCRSLGCTPKSQTTRAANGGKPYAINYFRASPDGIKVAVGISEGGSEDASITVYEAASGAKIGGPIDRHRLRVLARGTARVAAHQVNS